MNIEGGAADLAESLRGKFTEITREEHVFIHCIASMQDYCRVLDLLHKRTSIILLVASLPPSHVWEDFLEYLAQCGIPLFVTVSNIMLYRYVAGHEYERVHLYIIASGILLLVTFSLIGVRVAGGGA